MKHLYSIARRVWHGLPHSVQKCVRGTSLLNRGKVWVRNYTAGGATHNELYDDLYYRQSVDGPAKTSAPFLADLIIKTFDPKSAVDVGCGTGRLVEALISRGVNSMGLEYSTAGIRICEERGVPVRQFDLESDDSSALQGADVVVSLEVAEHLPERCADVYIALLTQLANDVVFSACPPGEEGMDHVNEQPESYWISKFREHSFAHLREESHSWRKSLHDSGAASWYHKHIMLFSREQT